MLYGIVRLQQINRVLVKIWDFVYEILVGDKLEQIPRGKL